MTMAQCTCVCHYTGEIICADCCTPDEDTSETMEHTVSAPPQGDWNKPAGDHDTPYTIGRKPTVQWPYPFNQEQFARLLIMRGKIRAKKDTA